MTWHALGFENVNYAADADSLWVWTPARAELTIGAEILENLDNPFTGPRIHVTNHLGISAKRFPYFLGFYQVAISKVGANDERTGRDAGLIWPTIEHVP